MRRRGMENEAAFLRQHAARFVPNPFIVLLTEHTPHSGSAACHSLQLHINTCSYYRRSHFFPLRDETDLSFSFLAHLGTFSLRCDQNLSQCCRKHLEIIRRRNTFHSLGFASRQRQHLPLTFSTLFKQQLNSSKANRNVPSSRKHEIPCT